MDTFDKISGKTRRTTYDSLVNMVAHGRGNVVGITSNIIMGGFLCLGITLLAVSAMVVLSLISLYIPNNSEEGYGELYRIPTLLLKALYGDIQRTFNNGTIADSIDLSAICGSVYRRLGAKQFAGCVATNFRAFGAPNASSINKRRRRAAAPVGLYEFGEVNLYYSTSCASKTDKGKHSNDTQLSSCAKSRLAACNGLVNGSSNSTVWEPLPSPFSQSIVDQSLTGYYTVNVQNLYGLPFSTAFSIASTLTPSGPIPGNLQLGCQFIGALSQADIAAALNSQATETTTLPTSTGPPSG